MSGVAQQEGRKRTREVRVRRLKSMCHCNARRDSLPSARKKTGTSDRRVAEEGAATTEVSACSHQEMITSLSLWLLLFFCFFSFFCLSLSPSPSVTLCRPQTPLDMPYRLYWSTVKCLFVTLMIVLTVKSDVDHDVFLLACAGTDYTKQHSSHSMFLYLDF